MKKTTEVKLVLVNSRTDKVTLVLEPWGETYLLNPEDQISLLACGPEGGYPELDYGVDAITYWGWEGSTVRAFRNGDELGGAKSDRTSIPEGAYPNIKQPRWD